MTALFHDSKLVQYSRELFTSWIRGSFLGSRLVWEIFVACEVWDPAAASCPVTSQSVVLRIGVSLGAEREAWARPCPIRSLCSAVIIKPTARSCSSPVPRQNHGQRQNSVARAGAAATPQPELPAPSCHRHLFTELAITDNSKSATQHSKFQILTVPSIW